MAELLPRSSRHACCQACLLNTPPHRFWSLADDYPDLVSRLHIQVRIMGNVGFNGGGGGGGGAPWLSHTQGALCFICKENVENVSHFLHDCTEFRQNFDSIWLSLKQKSFLRIRSMGRKFSILYLT